ncbi:MAG: hypothetical protein AAF367_01435 [Pseudomonadota bacterium]
MSFNQQQIDQMKQIGAQGGNVSTSGMSSHDKQIVDKAVLDGRNGK